MATPESENQGRPRAGPDETGTKRFRLKPSQLRRFFQGPWDLLAVAAVGIFVLGLVSFLYFAKPFLMPVVLAMLLNFLLKPVARSLGKFHLPEWLRSILVLAVFVAVLIIGISLITQPALEWARRAPESIQKIEQKVRNVLRHVQQLSRAAERVGDMATGETGSPSPRVSQTRYNVADAIVSYTTSFFTIALETIVLLYFLLAYSDLFLRKLTSMVTEAEDQRQVLDIAHEVQVNISSFLATITGINSCLGLLVGIGMWIVGMPNPVLWGVLAAFLNFIPYFGPLTGVTILTLAGFLTFETTGEALSPAIIYLAIHTIEANFITPTILGRRLTLNPVVIFVSLIFWTWLWGIPGALVAVPLLMLTKILCDHIRPMKALGEFLSG